MNHKNIQLSVETIGRTGLELFKHSKITVTPTVGGADVNILPYSL